MPWKGKAACLDACDVSAALIPTPLLILLWYHADGNPGYISAAFRELDPLENDCGSPMHIGPAPDRLGELPHLHPAQTVYALDAR